MDESRLPPVNRAMRFLIASILGVLMIGTAAVPHQHALTQLAAPDSQLALSAPDDSGGTRGHEYPCGACARQQGFALAPTTRHLAAPRAQMVHPAPAPGLAERTGQGPNVWLRGPPSATSAC
jgi:hypothetical protein